MTSLPPNGIATITQLRTDPRNIRLAETTANAIMRNNTSASRTPSGTVPVTSTANGSIVFNSEGLNYMRLCPVIQESTGGNTWASASMRVTGWNYDHPNNLWVPMPIADVAITVGSTNFVLSQIGATPNFRQAIGFTLNSGDAKIFATSAASNNGGSMCIDTWGCQRIELEFRGTTVVGSPVCNCFFMSV